MKETLLCCRYCILSYWQRLDCLADCSPLLALVMTTQRAAPCMALCMDAQRHDFRTFFPMPVRGIHPCWMTDCCHWWLVTRCCKPCPAVDLCSWLRPWLQCNEEECSANGVSIASGHGE